MAHAPGDRQAGHTVMHRVGSGSGRVGRAWRSLPSERRLAAGASIGLFFTLFLPWYQDTVVVAGRSGSASLTGWGAFSFVEAAVLLVAAAVLTLLFQRAEGRAFHVPGGDGGAITAAGCWTAVLVLWRIFDKQSVHVKGPGATVSGIEWGIFLALALALLLAYAGSRVRAAHAAEPPLPGEDLAPAGAASASGGRPAASGAPRVAEPVGAPARPQSPPTPVGDPAVHALDPQPPRSEPRPAIPPERPPGWLSAKPKQQLSDEQLTIPLDDREG